MSTKSTIILTSSNEHWYRETIDGSIILEIDANIHEVRDDNDNILHGDIEVVVRPDTALHKVLSDANFVGGV